jgi:hypothetical protein
MVEICCDFQQLLDISTVWVFRDIFGKFVVILNVKTRKSLRNLIIFDLVFSSVVWEIPSV